MLRFRSLSVFACVAVLSACSSADDGFFATSRNTQSPLDRPERMEPAHLALREQATQLEDHLHMLVRVPVAGQGCGVLRLSDPAMAQCSEAHLKGRTIGNGAELRDAAWSAEQITRATALMVIKTTRISIIFAAHIQYNIRLSDKLCITSSNQLKGG